MELNQLVALRAVGRPTFVDWIVLQRLCFDDVPQHVDAESVDTKLQPEFQHA